MQVLPDNLQREQDYLYRKWCDNTEGLGLVEYVMSKGSPELIKANKAYEKMVNTALKNGEIIN